MKSLLNALRPAEDLGLVQSDDVAGNWRFHHAITRYALADTVRSSDRLELHLKIAELLEEEW